MATPIKEETLVTITIDDKQYEVPAGSNLVDAAKWHADNDIPVFCYHPKMEPVGMCRMCIVELGMEMRDRQTGELMLNDDGSPQIRWFPKLQTACTQIVADGLYVRTNSQQVDESREHVLEFLLTSHPLDCPICDKGGECPLQNLTMEHGPGQSRMTFGDKLTLGKHLPLGDLIYLDQERCIQCARCVRFQDELVGDDVLAFHERGRRLQIITNSDPGFDTYFSGNTTDICPVGALTTADFRFGARPWELNEVPSICPHDAAGSNISLSMRLDREFGGKALIKRVMPRQNEHVNEIWISDRTRFVHHFTRSENRLMQPMVRKEDGLQAVTWNSALASISKVLEEAGGDVAVLAGGAVTNEDLWELRQLVEGLGGERLGAWPYHHTGADIVAQVGVGKGTMLKTLGAGDVVVVVASDLEEEVPMWRYYAKLAQDKGAALYVFNARPTRLGEFAAQEERNLKPMKGAQVLYEPGKAADTLANLKDDQPEIAQALADAENLIIIVGSEGLNQAQSRALTQTAANILIETGHVGKPNNGLLSTIPGPNGMGLHYLGYTPETTTDIIANPPKLLIVAQCEPAEDDINTAEWLEKAETVITLGLFPDKTTDYADFALPIQSFAERDGTFVNGERRVQRFYTAQGPQGDALPMWKLVANLRERLGQGRAKLSAAAVMLDLTRHVEVFDGMRYKELGRVERQFPDVGGDDKYYGGTAYQNSGGLGIQIASAADNGDVATSDIETAEGVTLNDGEMLIIPTTRLYNRSNMVKPSKLLDPRITVAHVGLNADDAERLGIQNGDQVRVTYGDVEMLVMAHRFAGNPAGVIIMPRHLTETPVPLAPVAGNIEKVNEPVLVQ